MDSTNTLYIADRDNHRIRAVTTDTPTILDDPSPDFNADQRVDFEDFLLFVANFGAENGEENFDSKFDLDLDGVIGFGDFLLFVQAFNR